MAAPLGTVGTELPAPGSGTLSAPVRFLLELLPEADSSPNPLDPTRGSQCAVNSGDVPREREGMFARVLQIG